MGKNKALMLIAAWLMGTALISGCVPSGAQPEAGAGNWTFIIVLVLIFVVFYFLAIRPQRRRQREHQKLVEELKKGDNVVTAGGIYGVVEGVSDDSIVIKVESGTTMRVARTSVAIKRER